MTNIQTSEKVDIKKKKANEFCVSQIKQHFTR